MEPFVPLFRNPHVATIAAHLWPRPATERLYPVARRLYSTDRDTQILVEEQQPQGTPRADLVLIHGLESSSRAGYVRSLGHRALGEGFAVHRMNLRSCGGTESLCRTAYHSGLTCDLHAVVRELRAAANRPVFIAGFSLGGNVALKAAGELGERAHGLLAGVCAVSVPIDLAACSDAISRPENRMYERRFLRGLKRRMRARHSLDPSSSLDGLEGIRSIREFDDRFTAPAFGFAGADDYYHTQSALRFVDRIRIPALIVQAKDDPVVPFAPFRDTALLLNPCITLIATEHGGHIGFLSRRRPRFWSDEAVFAWMLRRLAMASEGR